MESILRAEKIYKSFGANLVLQDVSITVEAGQVHAVMGENGAGKSTLMNILGGIHRPDQGKIYIEGQSVSFSDPLDAQKKGISLVHQELSLAPNMSIAQNIFIGREKQNRLGFIDWEGLYSDTLALFERLGVNLNPTTLVSQLSVGMQQIVEIAKALSYNSRIIIMDEPTSALSEKEVEQLYLIVRDLTTKGFAIVFISHKLDEVFTIADQITVLRDGHLVGTVKTAESSSSEIINMMVGRHIEDMYPPRSSTIGEILFSVEGFSQPPLFHDINFSLRKGEILGFAGLMGSGRTEVARAIVGADKSETGRIILKGKTFRPRSPREAIEHGLCYLTEDRKVLGLFLQMTIRENIVNAALNRFISAFGFLKDNSIKAESQRFMGMLEIHATDDTQTVINLSGGNQQKTMLAKWLCTNPQVLIVDEPTRGVDVGAKAKIHQELRRLADQGIGMIVISSDLPEVIGLCDRIAVFRQGRITAILDGNNTTSREVMKNATH
jgi:ABC-type sugar transport system ATPase subunit